MKILMCKVVNKTNENIAKELDGLTIIVVYKADKKGSLFLGFEEQDKEKGIKKMWELDQKEPYFCIGTFEEFRKQWLNGDLLDGILFIKNQDLEIIEEF